MRMAKKNPNIFTIGFKKGNPAHQKVVDILNGTEAVSYTHLYTAVTRAKTRVYLVGERNAISQAIHTDDSGTRRTMLSERIVYYYRQYQRQTVQENEQLRLAV